MDYFIKRGNNNISSILNANNNMKNDSQKMKLFNLDRKLASSQSSQILQGIHMLDSYLQQYYQLKLQQQLHNQSLQNLDKLFNRLFSLLKNQYNHNFYIKAQLANILIRYSYIIPKIHSKQQFINITSKIIKSYDQFTRILALKIIQSIPILFERDFFIYHILLSKLQNNIQLQIIQKVQSYKCIQSFLSNSLVLSSAFAKNIKEIHQQTKISTKVIISLCLHAKFKPLQYKSIIQSVSQLVNMKSKIEKRLFQEMYLKFTKNNYRLIQLYYKIYINKFPNIKTQIVFIQRSMYPFLAHNLQNLQQQFHHKQNISEFLDCLYDLKKRKKLSTDKQSLIQKQIIQIIKFKIKIDKQISSHTILLSNYATNFSTQIDKQILFKMKTSLLYENQYLHQKTVWNLYFKFLKQSLVSGNFACALGIINAALYNGNFVKIYENLIFLKIYCEMHLQSIQKFQQFQKYEQNVSKYQIDYKRLLNELCQSMKIIYQRSQFQTLSSLWSNRVQIIFSKLKNNEIRNQKQFQHLKYLNQQIQLIERVDKLQIQKNYLKKKDINWYSDILPGRLLSLYSKGYPLYFIYLNKKIVCGLLSLKSKGQ